MAALLRWIVGAARRGHADRSGAAALEYAVVVSLLISLILFVLEAGWQLTIDTALSFGAREASRFGITGQVTIPGMTNPPATRNQAIQYLVVARTGGLLNPDNIAINTKSYGSVSDLNSGSNSAAGAGTGGQIVEYDLSYTQPYLTPIAPLVTGRSSITHYATVIVQNEPF